MTSIVRKRRGGSPKMLGAIGRLYTFFWQVCNKWTAGDGVFNAERWIDSVVYRIRVNKQSMYMKLRDWKADL